jgi:hypothetical protein
VGHGDGDRLEIVALRAALGDLLVDVGRRVGDLLALEGGDLVFAPERSTSAAVSVVFPWSMWPIVPTLTCGLVRANTSLAIVPPQVQCKQPDAFVRTMG